MGMTEGQQGEQRALPRSGKSPKAEQRRRLGHPGHDHLVGVELVLGELVLADELVEGPALLRLPLLVAEVVLEAHHASGLG